MEIEQVSCDASRIGILAERRIDGDCLCEEHAEARCDARYESCEDDEDEGFEAEAEVDFKTADFLEIA